MNLKYTQSCLPPLLYLSVKLDFVYANERQCIPLFISQHVHHSFSLPGGECAAPLWDAVSFRGCAYLKLSLPRMEHERCILYCTSNDIFMCTTVYMHTTIHIYYNF